MRAKSKEAGRQLQKSGGLSGFGRKPELLSAFCFQLTWLQSISRVSASSGDVGLPPQAVSLAG